MTFAWYWHLKKSEWSLWKAILISWSIAFIEYCLMVPANRIGNKEGLETSQLKVIQEIITMLVFSCFAVFYLKEELRWNYIVGFILIVFAAFFIFKKW